MASVMSEFLNFGFMERSFWVLKIQCAHDPMTCSDPALAVGQPTPSPNIGKLWHTVHIEGQLWIVWAALTLEFLTQAPKGHASWEATCQSAQ